MHEIWFIRHGESEGNAGLKTQCPISISLTGLGHQQAKTVASQIDNQPCQIIMSKHIRTHQTATPTMKNFSDTPIETWDVQEFVYLNLQKWQGTTKYDRRPMASEYWEKYDPNYSDGEGAESFNQFIARAKETLDKLKRSSNDFTVIFSHGRFIRLICLLLYKPDLMPHELLEHLYRKKPFRTVQNGEIVKLKTDGKQFFHNFDFLKTNQADQVEELD